jgi:tyrosyl-tRNA synthetase
MIYYCTILSNFAALNKYSPMNFLEELKWRGMLQDITPETDEYLNQPMATGYIGFDPTAPSLTIGNYVQIMLLYLFQKYGHKPIILMGGATGRIGDPSHKDNERPLKTYEELDRNLQFQMKQFEKWLNFDSGDNKAIFRNNLDFYKNMNVLDFLRDVGKNLTVNYMMAKDSVKKRVETGLSFTEFSYQIIQGYDFQVLYTEDNCKLQMGGSDQWGNITAGTEIIRRNLGKKVYALTTPLLTKADGAKFGKSESGNIWLDPQLTSPYTFYQFWLNADDRDLEKFIRYFSLKPIKEIQELIEAIATEPNHVKKSFAEEMTIRIHSEEDFKSVEKVSNLLFQPKLNNNDLAEMSVFDWENVIREIGSHIVTTKDIKSANNIESLLTEQGHIFNSKSEFRRCVQQNAVSINKNKLSSTERTITESDFLHGKYLLIENGKKNKYVLKLNQP